MSTGKPRKRSKSEFKDIVTLIGMKRQDQIDFSWNAPKWFFRVTLWDDSHVCVSCLKEIETIDKASLDHIVPRSRGGRTRLANLQLMHSKCNVEKSDNMPEHYSYKAFLPTQSNRGAVTRYMKKHGAEATT